MTFRRALVVITIVVAASTFASIRAQAAHAGRVGDLRFVDAHDVGHALSSGGSATEFMLRLPDGATCPGDSEHDEWRTQAFLFAPSVNPASITYNAAGPEGQRVFKFYFTNTRPYRHELLEPNERPGAPGRIPPPAPMNFAVYPPGTISPGRYTAAVACTLNDALDRWWSVDIDITSDSSDRPAGLHWQVSGAAGASSAAGGASDRPLLVVALLVLGAVAVLFIYRNVIGTQRPTAPRKEKR